jgi:hypothetical protein
MYASGMPIKPILLSWREFRYKALARGVISEVGCRVIRL